MSGRRSVAGRPYAAGGAGRTIASGTVAGGGGGGGSVTLDSVDLSYASPGDSQVVNGSNLATNQAVTFGGVSCTVAAADGDTLTFTVPSGLATSGASYDLVVAGVTLASAFTWYAAPDIVNNASFETGWDGFKNSGSGDPSTCTRDTTHAYAGSYGVKRALPTTSGSDIGGYCDWHLASSVDRLWTRWYFYFDAAIDGILKFHQLYDGGYNTQFSGIYVNAGIATGHLTCFFTPESDGSGGIRGDIVALSGLVNGWHSFELDYWRNGDPSGYPSVAMWLDNSPITSFIGAYPKSPASWSNGRLNFGVRNSSNKIAVAHWLGVLNGAPANTVAGNVWIDRIAVSTVGRIGP